MSPDERDRLVRLETEMLDVREHLKEVKADVKSVLTQLNQMAGGRKALWGLLGAAATIGGLISQVISNIFSGQPHP